MNNIEFLQNMVKYDKLIECDIEKCEHCYWMYLTSQLAKEMLEKGDTGGNAIERFVLEHLRRWTKSKYFMVEETKEK